MRRNDDKMHIPVVLDLSACEKHEAPRGEPCFHIRKSRGGYYPAICNNRAVKVGYNAPIDPNSLSRKKGKDGKFTPKADAPKRV